MRFEMGYLLLLLRASAQVSLFYLISKYLFSIICEQQFLSLFPDRTNLLQSFGMNECFQCMSSRFKIDRIHLFLSFLHLTVQIAFSIRKHGWGGSLDITPLKR